MYLWQTTTPAIMDVLPCCLSPPAALIDRTTLANAILDAARQQYADSITFHFNSRLTGMDPQAHTARFEGEEAHTDIRCGFHIHP